MTTRGLFWTCTAATFLAMAFAGQAGAAKRLAVLEFGGDESIDDSGLRTLADKVRSESLNYLDASQWKVMTHENILVLLQANAEDLESCIGECEVETGRLLGAQMVVAGRAVKFGTRFTLLLHAYDTESGELMATAEATGADLDELWDGLGPACAQLFGGRAAPTARVTTTTRNEPTAFGDELQAQLTAQRARSTNELQAKSELNLIRSTISAAKREELLRLFVEKYEAGAGEPEMAPVTKAREFLRHYRTRGPVMGLWSQSVFSFLWDVGDIDGYYHGRADIVWALNFSLGDPGLPARNSSFLVYWGVGAGFKSVDTEDCDYSGTIDVCTGFYEFSPGHLLVGVGQILAGMDPNGNRQGVFLGQGLVLNIPAPDEVGWVEAEFQVLYSVHDRRGFLFQVGPRFSAFSMSGKGGFVPGIMFRYGGMNFLP